MNYIGWIEYCRIQCADGRHMFRTARRLRAVLVYERFPMRLRVMSSMRCWVCPLRINEPLELSALTRDMDRRSALKARIYGS
jgi:hypothetical protein